MELRGVLVVCIGNICRSPMAQCLLQRALPSVCVKSAGLGALVGEQADASARQLMSERGLSIDDHRASQISMSLVRESDLILVMTERQKHDLESMYPTARGKVFRVCHWSGLDVADPYRQSMSAFRDALTLIEQGVSEWHLKLNRNT